MDSLVSHDWLESALGSADLLVLDASWHLPSAGRDAASEFLEKHIPGAQFLDLGGLVDTASPIPAALPTRDQLEDRLQSLGARSDSSILLYDDSAIRSAARAWFMLRLYGVQRVAILDGGLGKWTAAGHPTESGESAATRIGDISLAEARSLVRIKADMLANLDRQAEQVLDARDAGRFTGSVEDKVHNLPGGHIPGACNLPFGQLFAEDGTYRSPDELRAAFRDSGIDPDRPLVTTCGSGMTASVLLFAHHLLGHDHGALYDGSWSEWGADPSTPKATGAVTA